MTRPESTSTRDLLVALAFPAATVGAVLLVAPGITVSARAVDLVTFLGASAVALVGVALGARLPLSGRAVAAIDLSAIVALAVVAIARARTPWIAPLVDAALIAFAWATGSAIGRRVQSPSHLLPAAAVAAAADVASVASSWGPSHAIAASEQALSVLAISFPVLGTRIVAPALGVGDLIFVALCLGVARTHALPYARIAMVSFFGVLVAGVGSALAGMAVPALPAIGAAVLLAVPAARQVARKDRSVTIIAIGVSLVVVISTIVSALRSQ